MQPNPTGCVYQTCPLIIESSTIAAVPDTGPFAILLKNGETVTIHPNPGAAVSAMGLILDDMVSGDLIAVSAAAGRDKAPVKYALDARDFRVDSTIRLAPCS